MTKLGTHDLCANMEKNCGKDFQNFDFTIFGEIFLILNLAYSSRAIEANRPSLVRFSEISK